MSSSPKKHHYLPQTIQRNFLADGEKLLWYYDREKDKYEQRTPKGIAKVRHLYSYDGVSLDQRYVLEKAFSVLEGKAAPIFLKLQKTEAINQEEHNIISEFVGMQYFRTPIKLDAITGVIDKGVEYFIENMHDKIVDMSDDDFQIFINQYGEQSGKEVSAITKENLMSYLMSGNIKLSNAKNFQLNTLVDAGTNLGIKLSARRWVILHTKPSHEFITSDVGLHLTVDGDATRNTGFGPGSPGMAIIFPFAKDAALMITSMPSANIAHVNFDNELVSVVNAGLARVSGQLYSSNKVLLEKLVKAGNLAKTIFKPIFDEEQMRLFAQKHFFEVSNR